MHITYVIIIIEYANPVGFINTVVILLHMVLEGTPVLSTIAFFFRSNHSSSSNYSQKCYPLIISLSVSNMSYLDHTSTDTIMKSIALLKVYWLPKNPS